MRNLEIIGNIIFVLLLIVFILNLKGVVTSSLFTASIIILLIFFIGAQFTLFLKRYLAGGGLIYRGPIAFWHVSKLVKPNKTKKHHRSELLAQLVLHFILLFGGFLYLLYLLKKAIL